MGKKKFRRSKAQVSTDTRKHSANYEAIATHNASLDNYYRNCRVFDSIQEWESCYETLKQPLPTTIRISGLDMNDFQWRKNRLESVYFASLPNQQIASCNDNNESQDNLPPPKPLGFYEPIGRAWVIYTTRTILRRQESYSKLHDYLVRETELGNISRQEAVSMLPPLFLDIQSHHVVLDMCAAPGSKTCQLIELLHQNHNEKTLPSGVIVANDVDENRANMLVHQLKRLHSPCVLVTQNDASSFPGHEGSIFDRILCDVPCSGDGTFRKNKLMWKTWSYKHAHALHPLQLRILTRGCTLLKVGGRLVYSTCSMNPIENEAVVATVLSAYPNSLKLVDVSNHLPNLITKPGVNSWQVQIDENGSFSEYYIDDENEHISKKTSIKSTFFPPKEHIPLNKCLRLYPHLQDTGGFFIAVIEKIAPLHPEHFKESKEKYSTNDKKPKDYWNDPIEFLDPINNSKHQDLVNSITKDYRVLNDFPFDNLVLRHEPSSQSNHHGNLFLVSHNMKNLLSHHSLKIISCGLKALTKCDPDIQDSSNVTHFRIQYEALPFIINSIGTERIIPISQDDIIILLKEEYPSIQQFSSILRDTMSNLTSSCYILVNESCRFSAPVWKGRHTLNCLINKKEKQSLYEKWTNL